MPSSIPSGFHRFPRFSTHGSSSRFLLWLLLPHLLHSLLRRLFLLPRLRLWARRRVVVRFGSYLLPPVNKEPPNKEPIAKFCENAKKSPTVTYLQPRLEQATSREILGN